MIKVQVFNNSEGMRCLTDKTGGGNKIAVPPKENGQSPRVEVTQAQFVDCFPELLKLTSRKTLVLEATNGEVTQAIPFEFAAKHFGFKKDGDVWSYTPPTPKPIIEPKPIAGLEPPPGFRPLDLGDPGSAE